MLKLSVHPGVGGFCTCRKGRIRCHGYVSPKLPSMLLWVLKLVYRWHRAVVWPSGAALAQGWDRQGCTAPKFGARQPQPVLWSHREQPGHSNIPRDCRNSTKWLPHLGGLGDRSGFGLGCKHRGLGGTLWVLGDAGISPRSFSPGAVPAIQLFIALPGQTNSKTQKPPVCGARDTDNCGTGQLGGPRIG